jgi:hypothetical protein
MLDRPIHCTEELQSEAFALDVVPEGSGSEFSHRLMVDGDLKGHWPQCP